tara:strand:- start:3364 stop:5766 length:2403 start_codon:yes stop_codon:yes gene_type:complete
MEVIEGLAEEYGHYSQCIKETIDKCERLEGMVTNKKKRDEYANELQTSDEDTLQIVKQQLLENRSNEKFFEKKMLKLDKTAREKGYDISHTREYYEGVVDSEAEAHLDRVRPIQHRPDRLFHAYQPTVDADSDEDDNAEIHVLDPTAIAGLDETTKQANTFEIFTEKMDTTKKTVFLQNGDIEISKSLKGVLKPHQRRALELLLEEVGVNSRGYLLAHSMGLGKTLTILAFVDAMTKAQPNFHTIVCVPLSLIQGWLTEYTVWNVYLTIKLYMDAGQWLQTGGILLLTHDEYKGSKLHASVYKACQLLVIDEAHILKNEKTLMYRRVKETTPSRIILATGTPLQNYICEYITMIQLIQPQLFSDKDVKKSFTTVIQKGSLSNATEEQVSEARKKVVVFGLMTKDCVHRRSNKLLLKSLQPKHEYRIGLNVDLSKLNHEDPSIMAITHKTFDTFMKERMKCVKLLLKEILNNTTEKILVFCTRKQFLADLRRKIPGLLMDGETSPQERKTLVDSFSNGLDRVFYMTTRTGGVGLNLQSASRVIMVNGSWNPSIDKQACFRAYRYGQEKEVFVYRFVLLGTIEEHIYQLAAHKNLMSMRLVDDVDVERIFSKDMLARKTEFTYDVLRRTGDAIIDKFTDIFQVSSHDVLFLEADIDSLSAEEEAEAANDFNGLKGKQVDRIVKSQDGIVHTLSTKHDIYFPASKVLVPPLAMSYVRLQGHTLTWDRLFPSAKEISGYDIEIEKNGQVHSEYFESIEKTSQRWLSIDMPSKAKGIEYRVRCRSVTRETLDKSDWSEWSAKLIM